MKGSQVRPGNKLGMARIVKDLSSSVSDRFITMAEAQVLVNDGEIFPLNVGKDYPNTYLSRNRAKSRSGALV